MAVASFCSSYQGGEGGKENQAYFGRLLTVNNRRGQNSNSSKRWPVTLNLFFPLPFLSSPLLLFLTILFREELAMRLDLTEARVQVSVLFIFYPNSDAL